MALKEHGIPLNMHKLWVCSIMNAVNSSNICNICTWVLEEAST